MPVSYYIDSCIYLNLWQKEKNRFGKPLWKITKKFLEKIKNEQSIVYYSGYLLKELSFILPKKIFNEKLKMFNHTPCFKRGGLTLDEFNLAKQIKTRLNNSLSFYDIIHMIIAKKTNSILITRDRELLKLAKKYKIKSHKPEELF